MYDSMYDQKFIAQKATAICAYDFTAHELYRILRFYGAITHTNGPAINDVDFIQSSIVKNCNNASDIYHFMRKYNLAKIEKSNNFVTYDDMHFITQMRIPSYDVYRLFSGKGTINTYNEYVDSFSTYEFYHYTIHGKKFKLHASMGDMMLFASRMLANMQASTKSFDIIPSEMIYNYYKNSVVSRPIVRGPKKPKPASDKPRAIMRGLVHTDYYVKENDPNNKQLKRDRYNDTHGTVSITIDVLQVLFKKCIRESDNARHTIHVYNNRCKTLVNNLSKVDDMEMVRIVYAKRHNIRVALYAIVKRRNERARICYFNIKSDIGHTMWYTFKNNKPKQKDYVRLSKVEDKNIIIYSDKIL